MCEYVISDLKSGGWHHFSAGNVIDLMDQFVVAVDFDVLVDVQYCRVDQIPAGRVFFGIGYREGQSYYYIPVLKLKITKVWHKADVRQQVKEVEIDFLVSPPSGVRIQWQGFGASEQLTQEHTSQCFTVGERMRWPMGLDSMRKLVQYLDFVELDRGQRSSAYRSLIYRAVYICPRLRIKRKLTTVEVLTSFQASRQSARKLQATRRSSSPAYLKCCSRKLSKLVGTIGKSHGLFGSQSETNGCLNTCVMLGGCRENSLSGAEIRGGNSVDLIVWSTLRG